MTKKTIHKTMQYMQTNVAEEHPKFRLEQSFRGIEQTIHDHIARTVAVVDSIKEENSKVQNILKKKVNKIITVTLETTIQDMESADDQTHS